MSKSASNRCEDKFDGVMRMVENDRRGMLWTVMQRISVSGDLRRGGVVSDVR